MKLFVAVTDNDWYKHLAALKPEEVNFWRPGGGSFRAIEIGAPFLFKLHSPLNFIVGGGFFVRSDQLPLTLAWDAFGEKNGAASFADLRRLIVRHRRSSEIDPEIGCIILNAPFFLPEDRWIPVPKNFAANIVTGKTHDTDEESGRRLLEQVIDVLQSAHIPAIGEPEKKMLAEAPSGYGKEYLTRARLGQGMFRLMVEEAYQRRCSVTGEKTRPVLQAAHIKPFADSGPNRVDNGLLMRSDLHILFDQGYITVTPDFHVEVSRRIKEKFDNGREYHPFHGRRLVVLPDKPDQWPSQTFIDWHNRKVFIA